MSDMSERLRTGARMLPTTILDQAADEIDRLTAELERREHLTINMDLDRRAEIERLLDQVAYLAEENIGYVAQLNEALGRIAELEAENERLVELVCEAFESDDPGSFQEWCDMNGYRLAKGERHE